MANKLTIPAFGCYACPDYQLIGSFPGETRYCNGFKNRKAKRFRRSGPKFKPPKWCPRKVSPSICRIYSFVDEDSEYLEMLHRVDYEEGRSKEI